MFKPRFSFASVLVMIATLIAIGAWMFRMSGGGLEFRRGVPFAWYHWADYKNTSPFSLLSFIGDILFWVPIVLGIGALN